MTRRWNARLMIPAFIFAGIPLIFIAGYRRFPAGEERAGRAAARANTVLSFKTIRAANAVDEAIQDAERGQRGFLITGQEVYLDPYTQGERTPASAMVELQQATQRECRPATTASPAASRHHYQDERARIDDHRDAATGIRGRQGYREH